MHAQPARQISLISYVPKFAALVMLVGLSACMVWTTQGLAWPEVIVIILVGCCVGVLAGGLVGVPMIPCVMAMVVFAGLFEGIRLGAHTWGWPGALIGGVAGFVIGHIVAFFPIMLIHLACCFLKVDFVVNDTPQVKAENSPKEQI